MSIVPEDSIEVIAQSIGINNLCADVAPSFAPDVEYHIREIMQEAIKCMRHSRRTVLTSEDVSSALGLRNVEPIYGFASSDPLRFKRAVGHKDLYYTDDKDVDLKDIIEAPLPKAPLDTAVVVHWLAIEGIQPAIPENAPVEAIAAPPESKKSESTKDDTLPIDIKLPVKHILSKELQMYFDRITELIVNKSDTSLLKEALNSLSTDSGLHPLVPYFSYFIADEITRSLNDLPLVFALMHVVQSLLRNPHIHIEPYLHQLMPPIITCLVAKRLGNRYVDNHWELRDFSANLVASICKRYGHVYHNLQSRLTKTLLHAFLDPTKAMTQHYGAIQGLAALGPSVVRLLILPNLETYMQLLEPEMLLEKQKNEIKRNEAWHVYGALLHAAGNCLRDRLKLSPGILLPPQRPIWRINSRVVTNPNKSKQPPFKKLAIDGLAGMIPMTAETQGVGDGRTTTAALAPVENKPSVTSDGSNRQASSHTSSVLAQAWKDDVHAGHLLASLYELFGEAMFPFTQPVEMSFFL